MKPIFCAKAGQRAIAFLLVLVLTSGGCTAAYTGNQAEDLTAVALSQLGYTAGPKDDTPYGTWYGMPNVYWCAIFLSWCARTAKISTQIIPQFASCTTGMNWFRQRGLWQESQWRGGNYVPRRGDLIFFNWTQTDNCNHVGVVLQTENGFVYTVEGNTNTHRWAEDGSPPPEPPGRVVAKRYLLESREIRGYATPAYKGGTVVVPHPEGFLDLADYADQREKIEAIDKANLLPALSSSFYGELYRATRGDFILALVKLFGLEEVNADTLPFEDLLPEDPRQQVSLVARSAGILQGDGTNRCFLDAALTPEAANTMLRRAEAYLQTRTAWRDLGDTPYIVRGQLAGALYDLLQQTILVTCTSLPVHLNEESHTLTAYSSETGHYVALEEVQSLVAHTSAAFTAKWSEQNEMLLQKAERIQREVELQESPPVPTEPPVPKEPVVAEPRRILTETINVRYGETRITVPVINLNGKRYYLLEPLVLLLGVDLTM